MANTGFISTKIALAFAGMTIFGTLLMVGTSENEGVLGQIASQLSEQPGDETHGESDTVVAEPKVSAKAPVSTWASPVTEISDNDVPPERTISEAPRPGFAPAPLADSSDPTKASLSPGAVIVEDDDD